jgi:ATP-binding cassette subfamily C (CFTR/MRP) protein 1
VLQHINPIDPNLDVAVRVNDATFRWATAEPVEGQDSKTGAKGTSGEKQAMKRSEGEKPRSSEETLVAPFAISNLNITIPRGRLVGIVGPVGSGKSSLLQGVRQWQFTS